MTAILIATVAVFYGLAAFIAGYLTGLKRRTDAVDADTMMTLVDRIIEREAPFACIDGPVDPVSGLYVGKPRRRRDDLYYTPDNVIRIIDPESNTGGYLARIIGNPPFGAGPRKTDD